MTRLLLALTALAFLLGVLAIGCGSDELATFPGTGLGAPDQDSGSAQPDAPATYFLGGRVTGLVGTGLVLQNNASDDLAVSVSGTFVFPTRVVGGSAFSITIKTHPKAPSQTCSVSGGSGAVASADVTTVVVNCGPDPTSVAP